MQFLRKNTATRVTVGPVIGTDGLTPATAITVTSSKLTFTVDDAGVPTLVLDTNPTASGGANDMVHITGDDGGFYDLELAAADVNYVGRAKLALTNAAAHCPVYHEFFILPAEVYDALTGADYKIWGVKAAGTLDGTPTTTTADLGTNAPAHDISGSVLAIVGFPDRIVDSYNTGTGVATFSPALGSAPSAGVAWKLYVSPPASTTSLISPDPASVRSAVGLASANLDSQLGAIDGKTTNLPSDPADASIIAGRFDTVDAAVAAVHAKTTNLPNDPADQSLIIAATDALATLIADLPTNAELATALGTADDAVLAAIAAIMTTTLTESYAADGATVTVAQALYEILALLGEASVVGTTLTTKKRNGSTTAATYTLDDATDPTAITRAT